MAAPVKIVASSLKFGYSPPVCVNWLSISSVRLCSSSSSATAENGGETEDRRRPYPHYEQSGKCWQSGPKYERKMLMRYGKASGIDPSICWPTKKELDQTKALQKKFTPTLWEMQERLEAYRKQLEEKVRERENRISKAIEKLPALTAKYRQERQERNKVFSLKKKDQAKYAQLAMEQYGTPVEKDSRFNRLVLQVEQEQRTIEAAKLKESKIKKREEHKKIMKKLREIENQEEEEEPN